MFRKLALFMALGAGVSLPLANLAEAAVADGIVIVVLVELVIVGWRFAVLQTDQLYPSAGVPKAWAAAAIPIGALLMIPRYLLDALRRLGLLAGS